MATTPRRVHDNRQADGGKRRNLIKMGPNLLTVPQVARQYSSGALHVMACIAFGRDPDSVPVGASEDEILQFGEKADIPWKDRMRGAETVLNRAVGKPLDFQAMRDLERIEGSKTIEMSTDDLMKIAMGEEIET